MFGPLPLGRSAAGLLPERPGWAPAAALVAPAAFAFAFAAGVPGFAFAAGVLPELPGVPSLAAGVLPELPGAFVLEAGVLAELLGALLTGDAAVVDVLEGETAGASPAAACGAGAVAGADAAPAAVGAVLAVFALEAIGRRPRWPARPRACARVVGRCVVERALVGTAVAGSVLTVGKGPTKVAVVGCAARSSERS